MAITEQQLERAEQRMQVVRDAGHAVSARYDAQASRIVVVLNNGVELAVPVSRIEGLSDAEPEDLADIEISPAGLGLHWPRLDADVYVPALLQGIFGSRRWMAAQLGAQGGKMKSDAKADAARVNGRKGGRPRKIAS
jgi:protein involved in temperature-dependent protein secretion